LSFQVNGSIELNGGSDADLPVWQSLESLGHMIVDSVLFDERRSSILVEVCPLIEETFILKDARIKTQTKTEGIKSSQDSKETASG